MRCTCVSKAHIRGRRGLVSRAATGGRGLHTGLFVSTFSVWPQLWLIVRNRGSIEALVCHHVTAMAVSRIISGLFMWYAWDDITCKPWIVGYNHAIVAILAAHALHLVLLADFLYCYIHAVTSQGLDCRIDMQAELEV